MSSNLVYRLRGDDLSDDPMGLMNEAADEIEKLMNRITDLEAALKFVEVQRDEYRRALEKK